MLPTVLLALAAILPTPGDDLEAARQRDRQAVRDRAVREIVAAELRRGQPEADKDIRKVLADQVAAWNSGDLDGFMKGYWADEKLVFISGGKQVKGFKALKDRYDANYRGEGKEMGTLKFDEVTVELLGPAVALVHGKWEVTTKKETVGGWYTLVFRKIGNDWKITHDHTSK